MRRHPALVPFRLPLPGAHKLAPLLVALAAACSPAGVELPDASNGGADGGQGSGLEPSELFGPCTDDLQCPGEGAFCRKNTDGFPDGVCTRPCENRNDCFVGSSELWNYCIPQQGGGSLCEQRCVNGLDCGRPGYTCLMGQPNEGGLCRPVCATDEACGEGAKCNRSSGYCVSAATTIAGAVNGSTCTKAEDCASGACVPEKAANGAPTGYLGGMCQGPCALPTGWNNNTIFADDRFAPGTCGNGFVCLPNGDFARGSEGTCVPECEQDSDCREGFACLTTLRLPNGETNTWDNGWCTPIDCTEKACPDGYLCRFNGNNYACAKDED